MIYYESKKERKERKLRFMHHPPHGTQTKRFETIREWASNFAEHVTINCPRCREADIALQKIEEAVMFANAAIARREA